MPNPDFPSNASIQSINSLTFVDPKPIYQATTALNGNLSLDDSIKQQNIDLDSSSQSNPVTLPQPRFLDCCLLFDRSTQFCILINRYTGQMILDQYIINMFGLQNYQHLFVPTSPTTSSSTSSSKQFPLPSSSPISSLPPVAPHGIGLTPDIDTSLVPINSSLSPCSVDLPYYPLPTPTTLKRDIYGRLGAHRLIRGFYLEVITQVETKC